MNTDCKTARDQFALMLYGELNFDEEERVETHLDGCAECRAALARQKNLHDALDASAITPSPDLLARSRAQLAGALDQAELEKSRRNWWSEMVSGLGLRWAHPILQPLGALALLTMGFFGAKLTPDVFQSASLANLGNARVRNVATEGDGRVQIVLDESRQRTIEGRLDDEKIRTLLMSAAKNAPDAGVREQTITILVKGADASEVRDALVFALTNDEDGRVRAKAMAGLKPYATELAVQQALAQSMLSEADVNMREQAVQMLSVQQARELNQQIVGSLQELMIREGNDRVREQVRRVLEAVKASPDMF